MTETIVYAVDGNVARITLDDGKVNAMSLPFFEALGAALDRAEREKPGAVVITGRAGYFSAGLDLKLMPTLAPDELQRMLLSFGRTMLRVFTFPIPTVAALSGHAIAGGAMLAFACDLRYAADGAFRLHLNEVAIGLTLPTWAMIVAQSAVPHRWHTEAILHARPYLPADALERSLVTAVVPPERLHPHFVRDIGAAFLTLGVALWAAAPAARRHPGVLRATALFYGLHALVHVADLLAGRLAADHWLVDLPGVFVPAIGLAVLSLPRWWEV